jgi:hypothetical protein
MGDKLRMINAYYYGFYETGVEPIDKILKAVAAAGKAYHHTMYWQDNTFFGPEGLGDNPEEWIQNAANMAAEYVRGKEV